MAIGDAGVINVHVRCCDGRIKKNTKSKVLQMVTHVYILNGDKLPLKELGQSWRRRRRRSSLSGVISP